MINLFTVYCLLIMLVSQAELIQGAISGKVVSFPTDTVPALAVKPELGDSIYRLKQRSAQKPLILLASSFDDLLPYIRYSSDELSMWQQVVKQYLPGALTLVLPASDMVPSAINSTDSQTVGVRIPNCRAALEILQQTGAMATSSANISGQDTLTTRVAIASAFDSVLILDEMDAFPGSGLPSTVALWDNSHWQILRQGKIVI